MRESIKRTGSNLGFRYRLGTLLLLVVMGGVFAAWISDRLRLEERNRRLLSTNRAQKDQIGRLKQRLELRASAMQTIYWWASADEFIEMLKTTADEEAFLEKAPSLAGADQLVVDEAITKLIRLLESQDERTTERALTSLRFVHESAPEKVESHASRIVSAVVPLLNSDSDRTIATSIHTLASFGAASRDALPQLKELMNNDSEWLAPDAAVAIAQIEPTAKVGPRLIELVEMKHPNWYQAAFHLPRFVDADLARRVLDDAYATAESEAEREMATIALNQIPADAEPGVEREPE